MVRGVATMRKLLTGWMWGAGWLAALLATNASGIPRSELSLARLSAGEARLESVQVTLEEAGTGSALSLRIGRLSAAGVTLDDLVWRCTLRREGAAPQCSGPLHWRHGPPGSLRLRQDQGWQARWRSADARIDVRSDAALQAVTLVWQQLPLEWLNPAAAGRLPDGLSITDGALSGEAHGDSGLDVWRGEIKLSHGALDSRDGLSAAAGLEGSARFHWVGGAASTLDLDITLVSGELLYDQVYVPLAASSRIELSLAGASDGWSLRAPLSLIDGEGAEFRLSLDGGQRAAPGWTLALQLPDLSRSGPRYLAGPLAAAGFAGAAFAGGLKAELSGAGAGLERVTLDAGALTFADPKGVVVLSGLEGQLNWQASGVASPSRLDWQSLSLQGIALGPATLRGTSRDGVFEADAPLAFAPFGGSLSLFPLRVDPLALSADFEARMEGIRLAALSAQLGWPEFQGSVSGSLPSASYRNHVLSSDGRLNIVVFDGDVSVGGLRWERPFGVAPSIAAELDFDDLDLEPLTGAFGFGAISGRLDGYVHGLRVLDGSPVAFDAFLHTDDAWKGKRRISQRAVNNIGSVGGGAAAGLQQTMLSLFDTFGYRRIGLRCRLANNVCEMGGVEDLQNGYVLIEGAGLPRVTVNGYRRRVDWPILLSRLQAAASGGGISVD